MSKPARATKLDKSVSTKPHSVGVTKQTEQPIPPPAKAGPARATTKDNALEKIRQKYGEAEYQKAVKQYKQTFRGEQRTGQVRNKDNSHG